MLFADRVAAVLAAEGVEFIVGFPENRLAAVAQAYGDRTPLLILPSAYDRGDEAYMPDDAVSRYGANRLSGDYAANARGLGAHGERVTDPAQLRPALERGVASVARGVAALIEVLTREEPVFALG